MNYNRLEYVLLEKNDYEKKNDRTGNGSSRTALGW